jgi:uncharacterized protein YoaH (UPF0181 family)
VFGVSWRAYRAILVACVVVYGLPFGVSVWGIAAAALVSLSVTGVAGRIADACSVNTLDADPEKVRQLEEETGFALPTLDDAEIKTLVQQVQDATGLSQDKAIAYVANDLERPTNAIQSIVNPIKAALPRPGDRITVESMQTIMAEQVQQALAVPPHMFDYRELRSQPPLTSSQVNDWYWCDVVLLDDTGRQRMRVPIPPPWRWEFVDAGTASYAGTNNSRRFRCLDAVRFGFTEYIIGMGWILKIGDYESELVDLTMGRKGFANGDMLIIQDIKINEDTYMRLLAAYKEDHACIPPDNDTALLRQIVSHTMSSSYPLPAIMPPLDNYTYPIGKETK